MHTIHSSGRCWFFFCWNFVTTSKKTCIFAVDRQCTRAFIVFSHWTRITTAENGRKRKENVKQIKNKREATTQQGFQIRKTHATHHWMSSLVCTHIHTHAHTWNFMDSWTCKTVEYLFHFFSCFSSFSRLFCIKTFIVACALMKNHCFDVHTISCLWQKAKEKGTDRSHNQLFLVHRKRFLVTRKTIRRLKFKSSPNKQINNKRMNWTHEFDVVLFHLRFWFVFFSFHCLFTWQQQRNTKINNRQ